jgi:hypothetical protein
LTPLFAGAVVSLATVCFAEALRLWLRALLTIRKTMDPEIRSKKQTRRPGIG